MGLDNLMVAATNRGDGLYRCRLARCRKISLAINDQVAHARELAELLKGRCALLNLIPYNPVAGLPYQTPEAAAIKKFCSEIERAGIEYFIRERKGSRIDAACGQLRRRNRQLVEIDGVRGN